MVSKRKVSSARRFTSIILITLLIASLSTIFVSRIKDTTAPVSYWNTRLLACQDKSITNTSDMMLEKYDCLRSALLDAVESNSIANYVSAISPIAESDVIFEQACHIPGHDIGKEVLKIYKGSWRDAIINTAYDVCGGGLVHGLYDEWGFSKHTDEEWVEFAGYCVEALSIRHNVCADGLGHAAYESVGKDMSKALRICDLFPDFDLPHFCAIGVAMQAYFPLGKIGDQLEQKNKPDRHITLKTPDDWRGFIEFCDRIELSNGATKAGCYSGAGWLYGTHIYHLLYEMFPIESDFQTSAEIDSALISMLRSAIDNCEAAKDANISTKNACIFLVLTRMPWFFYEPIDKFIQYCKDATFSKRDILFYECLASGYENSTTEFMSRIISIYPDVNEALIRRGWVVDPIDG